MIEPPRNAYTHSPEPHANLFLGSLQLLYWILCRPTAWNNHFERLKAKANFWKNPGFWRLLVQGYIILPLLSYILIILFWWGRGEALEDIALRVAVGVAYGVALGVVVGVAYGVALGVAVGVAFGVAVGVAFGVAGGVAGGVALGVAFGVALGVALGVAFGVAFGVAVGVALSVTLITYYYRAYIFYPLFRLWHILIYRLDKKRIGKKPSLLRFHPAFLDEWQIAPFRGLDNHLLLLLEKSPLEAEAALNYLANTQQKKATQAALIELNRRKLEQCETLENIAAIHQQIGVGDLESNISKILNRFKKISKDTDAAIQQASIYNQRIALEEIAQDIDIFSQDLTLSNDENSSAFRTCAQQWLRIINTKIKEIIYLVETQQEIDNPYIFGNPLNEQVQVFLGRTAIALRIEELIIDSRRPPILLYGQRRMGKTSLLKNLCKLLPNRIIPLFVDLQGPASHSSNEVGFLYNLARKMIDSGKNQNSFNLPPLSRDSLEKDPFTVFDEWLDKVENTLDNHHILLSLDEFEVLDRAIVKGRFDEESILGYLRHIIQHRGRFKILIAGSHTLEEFQRWASYLINVQVIPVSYLEEEETRKLIEHPIPEFTLNYEPNAVQRVINLTRCHPCLVQLLCSEIVYLKNSHPIAKRRHANVRDIDDAIPKALQSGSFLFADLENNQITPLGAQILRVMAQQGEGEITPEQILLSQFGDELWNGIELLLRRDVIEKVEDGYRFQVELIRYWFSQIRN